MPDAEVIPIGAGGRPGRGSTRADTPSAASRSLAGTPRRAPRKRAATSASAEPAGAGTKAATRRRSAKTAPAATGSPAAKAARAAKIPAPARATPAAPAAPARKAPPRARKAAKPAPTAPGTRVPDDGLLPSLDPPQLPLQVDEPAPGHGPVGALAAMLAELAVQVTGPGSEEQAAQALAFLRRRLTGDYDVDLFGFDRELTENVLLPVLRPLYQKWFRVEVRGIENVPSTGGALIVANHSGTVPVDSLMTQVALLDEHPARRNLRMLGADLVFRMPVVGQMARKSGSTLACNEDAERLLSSGELAGVWPEGFKGVGKPFSERYKLQRFGRGGFVAAAMRTGAPIVPCSIVGAEEIYPLIGNLPTLARLIGVPYVPITPTFPWLGPLGLIPLPSKWIIEFGEPIRTDTYGEGAADDPMLVFNITDQVRETIQHSLYTLLMKRRSVFF